RERFLARARKHGLAVSPMRSRGALGSKLVIGLWPRLRYSQVAVLAMALLLAMVAFLGYSLRESNARYKTVAADLAAMHNSISPQSGPEKSPVKENQSASVSPLDVGTPRSVALPFRSVTDAELVQARQNHAAAEARSKALEEQLQAAAFELEALRTKREEASNARDQLEKN